MYLTDWSEPNPWGTRTTMEALGSGALRPTEGHPQEIWEGRRLGTEGVLALGMVDRTHSIHERDGVVRDLLQHTSRVLLRQGIDASLDELVRVAMTERSRPRQQFGTGPVVSKTRAPALPNSASEIERGSGHDASCC